VDRQPFLNPTYTKLILLFVLSAPLMRLMRPQGFGPRDRIDPSVTTTVAENNSRSIRVVGAVKKPLTFRISAPMTLLEAIALAGGFTPAAGSEILIGRPQPPPGGQPAMLKQHVPVQALIDGTNPEASLWLSGGEEVRVPEAGSNTAGQTNLTALKSFR
jgi:protein involved in polysaccharide export with SLBB domain